MERGAMSFLSKKPCRFLLGLFVRELMGLRKVRILVCL